MRGEHGFPASVRRVAWQNSLNAVRAAAILRTFDARIALSDLTIGSQIDVDGLALFPNRKRSAVSRVRSSSMGDQHFFAEGVMIGLGDDFRGDARQVAVPAVIFAGKDEGHQRGLGFPIFNPNWRASLVAERRCAHFGDRKATRRNDERQGLKFADSRVPRISVVRCTSGFGSVEKSGLPLPGTPIPAAP